jgi:DNA-directed RNA polymerase specialized sigma24 family protein
MIWGKLDKAAGDLDESLRRGWCSVARSLTSLLPWAARRRAAAALSDQQEQMLRAFEQMPPVRLRIYHLFCEGWDHQRIADQVGCTRAFVRAQLNEALLDLARVGDDGK